MKRNIWHSVSNHPELWVGQYVVPNFVSNSVVLEISATQCVVVSPGAALLEQFQAQFAKVSQLHIIFPNAYHHLGVDQWLQAYPDAKLYASQTAITQLKSKGFAQYSINALEQNTPPLPHGYHVLFPPGHRAGDIWLCKASTQGSTWITCDSFLNYERLSHQPIARFLQTLLQAAPGLKISQVVKWFILTNRQSFKAWVLPQLQQTPPTTLIPSHGEIRQGDDLAEAIAHTVKTRL